VALAGYTVADFWKQQRENNLWHMANLPLHQNLRGDDGSEVLTGAELSSVVALGVEEGNDIKRLGTTSCCCIRKRNT
jgi:hypothetical protein